MSDLDATDLVPHDAHAARRVRWKAIAGLAGLAGLAVAAYTVIGDARDRSLPTPGVLALALACHVVALTAAAQGWIALFPPGADRRALASGLYGSQLAKYLPAGGFVQAASQVALASGGGAGASAALRLPVFALCSVVAALTLGSGLMFAGELPSWARVLAGLGLLSPIALDRRVLHRLVRLARRLVRRLPDPDGLPPQRGIWRCYALALANLVMFGVAYALLLGDSASINPWVAIAAVSAAWAAGYVVVFVPGGLLVREAMLVAALPGLPTASIVAASVAHRMVGLVAEVVLAGVTQLRRVLSRSRQQP